MADLAALLARLEKAEGPDREIDCALSVALDGFWVEFGYGWRLDFCRKNADGSWSTPGHGGDQMVPRYTASLDAALALVERVAPTFVWSVQRYGGDWYPGYRCQARVARPFSGRNDHEDGKPSCKADAPTPALALLIALLRALPKEQESGE